MAAVKEPEDQYIVTARGYELIRDDPDSDDSQLLLAFCTQKTVRGVLLSLSQTEEQFKAGKTTKEQCDQHKRIAEKIYDKMEFYIILLMIEKRSIQSKTPLSIKFHVLWQQNGSNWNLPFTCRDAANKTADILREQPANKNVRVLLLDISD